MNEPTPPTNGDDDLKPAGLVPWGDGSYVVVNGAGRILRKVNEADMLRGSKKVGWLSNPNNT